MRQGGIGAVLLVDLDDFKGVNDTHGHFAGDQLLVAMAHRLELATRASDTLCRFGGDEFLYLAEGLTSREEAESLAERLLEVIAEPCDIDGTVISQRASVGMVDLGRQGRPTQARSSRTSTPRSTRPRAAAADTTSSSRRACTSERSVASRWPRSSSTP